MLIFLLFIGIFEVVVCSCPSGLSLVAHGECRGFYKRMDATFPQAVTQCQQIQAYPVIIHSEEDQAYWVGHVDNSTSPAHYVVIGLMCNANTKLWEWADGSALNYKPPLYDTALDSNCVSTLTWYMSPNGNGKWYSTNATPTYSFDIYCTKQLQLPIPADDGCESFEDDSEDGACYQIGVAPTNWKEAQMICRSFGADVAPIHNLNENSFVRRLAVSIGAVNGVFLGGTTSGKGDDFGWTDGSEWNYDNFFPGFPMSGLGDCLIMDTSGSSGQWVNVDCSTDMSVACARSQHYTEPACSSGPFEEGQIIYSPGFPFDASTPCDFILSVDAGKKVKLEVLFLEANSCCDQLTIFENYFGGNVIANLTGEVINHFYTTSSSNFMRVSWLPNGGVNVRGMMMTFRGV